MSRFRIDHPTREGVHAHAGLDHALGFFVSVHREGRPKPIKELDFFSASKPVTLQAVFEFLITENFITRDDLEAALVYLQDGSPKPRSKGVMRVVGIVERLRRE